MSAMMYNFAGDYKKVMNEYITLLERSLLSNPREVRIHLVQELTDAYVEQVGKRPDVKHLERLSNVILHEELSDPHPDKMTREEYPIMSERQYAKRTTGHTRRRNKAGVVTYEAPLDYASNVGTDGIDYTPHTRSFFNPR